jgi:hypothetical protein
MPGPTGQHTLILQQEPGYEKGNGVGHRSGLARDPRSKLPVALIASLRVPTLDAAVVREPTCGGQCGCYSQPVNMIPGVPPPKSEVEGQPASRAAHISGTSVDLLPVNVNGAKRKGAQCAHFGRRTGPYITRTGPDWLCFRKFAVFARTGMRFESHLGHSVSAGQFFPLGFRPHQFMAARAGYNMTC